MPEEVLPNLGAATTEELLRELGARMHIDLLAGLHVADTYAMQEVESSCAEALENLSKPCLEYRTVDS